MNRRPGLTLVEVLVSLFIMAIGMLALLTLFPLGALSMAQALRDDRAATCAQLATSHAIAMDIRHDALVTPLFTNPGNGLNAPLPTGSSYPLFVDPTYKSLGVNFVGIGGQGATTVPRATLSAPMGTNPARWMSLLDDITFASNGTPDTSGSGGTLVARGGVYSWCYLLRQPLSPSPSVVEMSVVVYRGRSVQLATGEDSFLATAATPPAANSLVINYAGNPPNIRPGGWIFDTSSSAAVNNGVPNGYFYRVTNTTDLGGGQLLVELQTNFTGPAPLSQVVVMENVIEVFPKGTGWQP